MIHYSAKTKEDNAHMSLFFFFSFFFSIAACFAVLSGVAGLFSHIQEFQRTCWTSWLSSCAAALTLIVLIFDFVIFGIARARINKVDPNVTRAAFGPALWITLVAWIVLAFSGCFFCAGRCMFNRSERRKRYSIEIDQRLADKPRR